VEQMAVAVAAEGFRLSMAPLHILATKLLLEETDLIVLPMGVMALLFTLPHR